MGVKKNKKKFAIIQKLVYFNNMTISEILDHQKEFNAEGCSLAFALSDLERKAGVIRQVADELIEEGDELSAKIHCSNVSKWMQEMQDMVQAALDKAIKEGA